MIKIHQLSFGYAKEKLFARVDSQVRAGELLHIAGPNGSGKSTLLSILVGLIAPQSGKVVSDGNTTKEYLPAESSGLFLRISALDNLRFWLSLKGQHLSNDLLIATLKHWGLASPMVLGGLSVEKFSTGMKRKLALARISLAPAKIWILDEPVLGLDEEAQNKFAAALSQHLRENKGCAVITSHETTSFAKLIDKTLWLPDFKKRDG